MDRIFVGNLPLDIVEHELRVIFEQYGAIKSIEMPADAETRRLKGFAFVKYARKESAILAADNFNGILLGERRIRVELVTRTEKGHSA